MGMCMNMRWQLSWECLPTQQTVPLRWLMYILSGSINGFGTGRTQRTTTHLIHERHDTREWLQVQSGVFKSGTLWNSSRSVCLGQTARLVTLLQPWAGCCGCLRERTIVGLIALVFGSFNLKNIKNWEKIVKQQYFLTRVWIFYLNPSIFYLST